MIRFFRDLGFFKNRTLVHIPLGLLTCLLSFVSWWLAGIFAVSFLCYELVEETAISDKSYHDIRGYLIGLVIGGVVMLGVNLYA